MAIFNRLSDDFIRSEFTHYWLFCGIVPVYANLSGLEPSLAVANWCPELLFDITAAVYNALTMPFGIDSTPIYTLKEI